MQRHGTINKYHCPYVISHLREEFSKMGLSLGPIKDLDSEITNKKSKATMWWKESKMVMFSVIIGKMYKVSLKLPFLNDTPEYRRMNPINWI